jgi:hypothetical protein
MSFRTTRTPPHTPNPFSFGKRKPSSPADTGKPQPSKVSITEEDRRLTQEQKLDRIFEKLFEWEPLIQKLESVGPVLEIIERVDKIDIELERMKKDQIAENIIIQGVEEGEREPYAELEKKVENIFGALNIGPIDCSYIKRVPLRNGQKPKAGSGRNIQVKLVRQKDKVRILGAKKNLKRTEGFSNIYINPELTKLERAREATLRETARAWKTTNKGIKFYIRGGRLTVNQGQEERRYFVNSDGLVEEIGQ